ncbi:MAG TPA: suppressor of fused domain protein [Phycisphaerae bacterium]|nr:suppressor of fused domain protein [Phycisphaerae bacterium]
MPDQPNKKSSDWDRIWNARIAALTPILCKPSNMVYHAPIPFYLGGFADVLPFPDFVPGVTYVTAEMTGEEMGQRPNSLGQYELMICARQELPKAADLISRLTRYTCDAVLEAHQTMDLGTFLGDSTIRALVFAYPRDEPVYFEFFDQHYGLLLCLGITAEELAFGRAHGNKNLLALLKEHGVFPYTIPDRPSIPLPQ